MKEPCHSCHGLGCLECGASGMVEVELKATDPLSVWPPCPMERTLECYQKHVDEMKYSMLNKLWKFTPDGAEPFATVSSKLVGTEGYPQWNKDPTRCFVHKSVSGVTHSRVEYTTFMLPSVFQSGEWNLPPELTQSRLDPRLRINHSFVAHHGNVRHVKVTVEFTETLAPDAPPPADAEDDSQES